MTTARMDLGDGWSQTADVTISLGSGGFEISNFDVKSYTKETKKGTRDLAVEGSGGRKDDGTGIEDVDKIWLGNSSRVMDGADSKAARFEIGNKMDVEELLAIINGDIVDENIRVSGFDDGDPSKVTIEFVNAKNDKIVDTLNITIDAFGAGALETGSKFINDDSNSTDTFVFASESASSNALLGYQKNFGGSNAKAGIAYEVVSNSADGETDAAPDRSLNMDKYDVDLVQQTAFSETYEISNGRTKKGEPVVDTITFIDDVFTPGDGLFDLG